MSDRFPSVFGRNRHGRQAYDDDDDDDDRDGGSNNHGYRQSEESSFTVPCTVTFTGLAGEIHGQARVTGHWASASGPGGSPRVQIDLRTAVFSRDADGTLRCSSPQAIMSSAAPDWIAWFNRGGVSSESGWVPDQRRDSNAGHQRRRRSSSSSGLLPIFSQGRQLGLSQFMSRWKGWHLGLIVGGVLVVGLAFVAVVIIVVVWGLGQLKEHGGDFKKALEPMIEQVR